jgi:hypothetical protein
VTSHLSIGERTFAGLPRYLRCAYRRFRTAVESFLIPHRPGLAPLASATAHPYLADLRLHERSKTNFSAEC